MASPTLSDPGVVMCGVPQGSIPGPLIDINEEMLKLSLWKVDNRLSDYLSKTESKITIKQ